MAQPDPAANRFWIMQAMRFSGMVLAIFGALILGQIIDLPQFVGAIFLVLGAVDFFIVPIVLAKRWKTPDQ